VKLRVLVVDDEQPARRRLIDLIARRPDLELAGTSADGREAIEAILTGAPDLVLLDVQMPELTGLDVVRTIGAERMPPVIFVTAHDRYALEAFDAHAVDYLLKPYDADRFRIALVRTAAYTSLGPVDVDRRRAWLGPAHGGADAGQRVPLVPRPDRAEPQRVGPPEQLGAP